MDERQRLEKALATYWMSVEADEQQKKRGYYSLGIELQAQRKSELDRALAAVRTMAEQSVETFGFQDWYLIHLVFPKDLMVYQKLVATAGAPHEKLYVIVVGIVYVDRHFGLPWATYADSHEFHDKTLSLEIARYRESVPDAELDGKEHFCAIRLVKASTLNHEIEHCAVAWLLSSRTRYKERHRYPLPRQRTKAV